VDILREKAIEAILRGEAIRDDSEFRDRDDRNIFMKYKMISFIVTCGILGAIIAGNIIIGIVIGSLLGLFVYIQLWLLFKVFYHAFYGW
jgi:hypothetical protein